MWDSPTTARLALGSSRAGARQNLIEEEGFFKIEKLIEFFPHKNDPKSPACKLTSFQLLQTLATEKNRKKRNVREKFTAGSVTSKKSPHVYKSCPKLISLEKLKILTPSQKLHKNVGALVKLIVAKGFEKLPKVKLITQSGHTDCRMERYK